MNNSTLVNYRPDYLDCSHTHRRGIPRAAKVYTHVAEISLQQYQSRCKKFDLIFFEGHHIKSRVVQFLTYSPFSHVGILLSDDLDQSFAEVAPVVGFYIGSLLKYSKYKGNIYVGRIAPDNLSEEVRIQNILDKYTGCKYENRATYKVIEKYFTRRTTKYSKDRYICSELVQDILDLHNISYPTREGDFVFPSDFEKSGMVEIIYKLS